LQHRAIAMPRLRRSFEKGLVYHVTQRGNNRCAMFVRPSDYELFRVCLGHGLRTYDIQLHAWAFMTTHVHLMVTPGDRDALPRLMQDIGRRYVPYFNRQHGRTGSLWEGRYKAAFVDTDHYFLECMRYVDLNPLNGGLVPRPEDYQWCSYRANALGDRDPLITPHSLYKALGLDNLQRQGHYRRLCATKITDEEHQRIRYEVNLRVVGGRLKVRTTQP
jgi:putative transposase